MRGSDSELNRTILIAIFNHCRCVSYRVPCQRDSFRLIAYRNICEKPMGVETTFFSNRNHPFLIVDRCRRCRHQFANVTRSISFAFCHVKLPATFPPSLHFQDLDRRHSMSDIEAITLIGAID